MTKNGTCFHDITPEKVVSILENSRLNRERIRIFYGDAETGRDWCEMYDTIGYVGRSCGEKKIPLLIKQSNSLGGGAILDHCIVKITIDKTVVYKHPKYHLPEFSVAEVEDENLKADGYNYSVLANGKVMLNCKTAQKAENAIKFFKGKRNIA